MVSEQGTTASRPIRSDPEELLSDRLQDLQERRSRRYRLYRTHLAIGVALIALSPFGWLYRKEVGLGALVYGAIFLAAAASSSPRDLNDQIQQVQDELELLTIKDTSREQRAQKLLKLHQSELKRYYDQTLRQTSVIFFAGLVCILLGFIVVGGSLYIIWKTGGNELRPKLIVGSLGAVGGILSNFVAVMYLKMFTQTISSLTEFHNRLVSTHHLYFGNFLMSKIKLDSDFYEKVLSEIAYLVSGHQGQMGGARPATLQKQPRPEGPKSRAQQEVSTP
ncbi:MAG TPA: hypothetical protein VEG64_02985 [Candidatus Sulfotelmatobacter sp.]|nr:hypothetical protein [Candidatus Sulfotelmatobacter sp.]